MKCVISGSFRKFYPQIVQFIELFENSGVEVLRPTKSRIVNPGDEGKYALLESDKQKSVLEIEKGHLEAIRKADFLYICDPGGYVGIGTSMEIGYAYSLGKPIYASEKPEDETLAEFVGVKPISSF